MKIRKAERDDIDAILALLSQYDREPDPKPESSAIENIFARFDSSNDGIFVSEVNGEIVGTFQLIISPQLNHSGRPFGVIENVVVDAEHRRKGIGKAMMREAQKIADALGCSKLFLISGEQRTDNHRFYEACGFSCNKVGFQMRFGV